MRHIRVAVPVPGLDALTYAVPEPLAVPPRGARVVVPLGQRLLTGIVIGPEAEPPAAGDGGIKPVSEILDHRAFLPGDVVDLVAWVAEYYACGIGDAMSAAMPPRAWVESERHARITEAGQGRLLQERGARRRILERLSAARPVAAGRLTGGSRSALDALRSLEADGLITLTQALVGTSNAFRTVRTAHLTATGEQLVTGMGPSEPPPSSPGGVRLSLRDRELLSWLSAAPEGLDTAALSRRGIPSPVLRRLMRAGLVTFSTRRIDRDPASHASSCVAMAAPLVLTAEQHAALRNLEGLCRRGEFGAALLHGVTGSGKTELYLRLTQEVAAQGKGVLMLVPEIALTPAVAGTFRALFGDRVAIQHSGLSDGERHDQWHRIREGQVQVVVGTRSAVFAPIADLGLVIVDEEHDGSYKQEESPRYNGRDVAVVRARAAGAVAVLGSATPSLESYYNASTGRYALVTLRNRVLDRPLAAVTIVDMRQEYADEGPDVVISRPLAAALTVRLERKEQSMVLLNRRGFATSLFCRQCGHTLECPNCSVTLTVHRAARRVRCHYCNYNVRVPTACAECGGTFLEHLGFGTERVEADVAALLPGARIARVDRDTVRRRGAITSLLRRFAARDIDVLVGTQMIAKGHDFPQVTLVGVISADVGLGFADFRAAERTFQLLTQVAGRAGRGEVAGEAMVQTIHPRHYSIRHACRQDYRAFYEEELTFRQSMQYPPSVAMINAVVRAGSMPDALRDAGEIVAALRWGGEPYRVLGPAPAPLSRLRGEHRAQLFLKGTQRGTMRKSLQKVLEARPEIRRRTIVDVDPMTVL